MTWNIAPESISLVMLGIILIYSRKGSRLPTLKNRMFQGCLVVTFCAMLTNILSTVMICFDQIAPLWSTWIITTLYFLLTPLMGLAYFLYTLAIIYIESPGLKKAFAFCSIPGLGYAVLILLNPFTRDIFDLTSAEGYTRGSLIITTYLIFYLYCLACLVITLVNYKKIDKEVSRILASFPVLAFLVILFQQAYPQIILSGTAATCALLIIYLHLQNKQISLDYLTNLPNRQELLNMLTLLLTRYPDRPFTLVVVSLRDFRLINNACGQQNGDVFLKSVSQFLSMVGPPQNVYRFSGDEFALLFSKEEDSRIRICILEIKDRMARPWEVNDYQFNLSAVMGVIRHTEAAQTLEETIASIEYAVVQAKSGKYGQICYCDSKMLSKLERRRRIIQILKEKLADESFEMFYQPIYEVKTGKFLYAESLMRMNDTPIGPVYPSEFIPIAEETGLLIDITYVIIKKVCCFINRLLDMKIPMECIHVNFSAIQFSQPNLAEKVLDIIHSCHTPAHTLKIEFTESTLAENPEIVKEFALEVEKHGIMMGLDDFGTGYSNIATVISLPFGTIKLDRSLICASMENSTSALAVKNMVRTFQELGMKVVAEGVETEEQNQLVIDFGIDQIQGFYYSKPLAEEEFLRFLM
ncbi:MULTISPECIES: bifunctional diguanylate cyclase/phosphodiesterase [Clostridia]|uniref:putative bifunctional diguanylate cyclase/phosphodiesterase n=1 Tax=Clostridia TaxID=186801 RepID=UPI00067F248B|nr:MULTISPECIES: bifunctional diguanylate cyclase/phosphodiesterase [Clostridia]